MVARVRSFAFEGLVTIPVEVQVQLSSGLPAFSIVGLADKAVAESRERVRAALTSIGLALPAKRITVNLSPADITKEGSHFDLPIIMAVLMAMEVVPSSSLQNYIVVGELALDGSICSVGGVLPAAISANERDMGIVCPRANGEEASWSGMDDILAPSHVMNLVQHLLGRQYMDRPRRVRHEDIPLASFDVDMAQVKGQAVAKRALEIAASGGHNVLMMGSPGAGKSMLARALPGILPPLSAREVLEVSMISSITGGASGGLSRSRPFRDPHHNCSMPAMVGGGSRAKPGEISLAHCGVLFLDELPEFSKNVLEALRQPLETQTVTVARVQSHVTYPADFQLIAAMNPCKCGYLGDLARACNKAPGCGAAYQSRLSGPLLDRIDMHIAVNALSPADMYDEGAAESSAQIRARVMKVRDVQQRRNGEEGGKPILNCRVSGEGLMSHMEDESARDLLRKAVEKFHLSVRGHNRTLRVARTIADLAGSDAICKAHIAEALGYRYIYS